MARPKEILTEPKPQKWERKFEDDECTEIWKFDSKKTTRGPVEVVITYKGGIDKQAKWNKRAKEAKDDRRTVRQMKKINNKNKK
jgi:hypothetical protein